MRAQAIDRDTAEGKIVAKALNNADFKRSLLSDPRAVIGRETGFELPPDMTIKVVEETPTTLYLVLPHVPQTDGSELSDSQLEAVAGGKAWLGSKKREGSEYLEAE